MFRLSLCLLVLLAACGPATDPCTAGNCLVPLAEWSPPTCYGGCMNALVEWEDDAPSP